MLFVHEVGVRMFMYNIVKMLIVIAIVAADASVCVWVMFHFGIVTGLSVVMVINIALACIVGYFVYKYSDRSKGKMHMEYGQHLVKGFSDTINSSALASTANQLAVISKQMDAAERNVEERRNELARAGSSLERATSLERGGGGALCFDRRREQWCANTGAGVLPICLLLHCDMYVTSATLGCSVNTRRRDQVARRCRGRGLGSKQCFLVPQRRIL